MFDNNTKILHIEPTTICNAKCPQCAREDENLYNDDINRNELTLEKCKELFDSEFIKNLDKMFMCGVFGDPASSKDALGIFKYFRKYNPTITLGMNTNGSIRNIKWWTELASIFNEPTDYVVFSIDGLEDTNHIYRRGVHWNKVMMNAEAFINAGGSAQWDMLIFKHNEHQINEVEQLARKMGFSWFRSKVSKRFETRPIDYLEAPISFELPNTKDVNEIKCHALEDKSLYVTAGGEKLPCCWIGPYTFNADPYLKSLLESDNWDGIVKSWDSNPHNVCSKTCGINNNNKKTSFESQWSKEIELR
jgi:hypothetical protein